MILFSFNSFCLDTAVDLTTLQIDMIHRVPSDLNTTRHLAQAAKKVTGEASNEYDS